MKEPREMFDFVRSRGTALVAQLSDELMRNPGFLRAVETAYRGKERLEGAVGQALKTMNVPTRSEFTLALARIDALEQELTRRPPRRTKSARKTAASRGSRRPAARRKKATSSRA